MSARSAGKKKRHAPRPVKPVLGNDPFERGAAPRAAAVAPEPPPADADQPPVAAAPPPPAPDLDLERRIEAIAREGERRLDDLGQKLRDRAEHRQARIRTDLAQLAARVVPFVRGRIAAAGRLRQALQGGGPVDAWGLDHDLVRAASPALDLLVNTWWRVVVRGLEHLPEGPAIVVANHGGAAHWDAIVLAHLFRSSGRELRPLLEAASLTSGRIGRTAARLGAVAASAEAAERILASGQSIAVFPQGHVGDVPWQDRYRIQRFGRGGFARIALRTGAPIVPCAIVGSEEAALPLARSGWLAEALAMPLLSSAPGLPVGPLDAVPLPSRWSIRFGEAVETAGRAADADLAARVNELAANVRGTLQSMLDEDVAARRSVYL